MAPITPGGPGPGSGSFNGSIVPLRPRAQQALPPLNPRKPIPRATPVRRGGAGGRANGAAGAQVGLQPGSVTDIETARIDPTSPFKQPSIDRTRDTITVSRRLNDYITQLRAKNLLNVWPKNISDFFTWSAQKAKGYVLYMLNGKVPGFVDVSAHGFYIAGGGY